MDPRESDPTGAFTGGGAAGLDDRDPDDARRDQHRTEVDETERQTITSATAATSEVADRAAREDAEGQGDGPPLRR
jgi:hypothetical protein